MPEYLAPGVYIEEVSFRNKTIEGVSTSTAGFVGPARYGPVQGEPTFVSSYGEFERYYGGLDPLTYGGKEMSNFLAHGVQAFFYEGGSRLYISRVFKPLTPSDPQSGHARKTIQLDGRSVTLRARYPGSGGNVEVTFRAKLGEDVLAGEPVDPADPAGAKIPVLRGARNYETVWISESGSPLSSPPGHGTLYWAEQVFDTTTNRETWRFHPEHGGGVLDLTALDADTDSVRILTASAEVTYPSRRIRRTSVWENLGLHPKHENSLSIVFGAELRRRQQRLEVPIVCDDDGLTGPQIARVIFGQAPNQVQRARLLALRGLAATDTTTDLSILTVIPDPTVSDEFLSITFALEQGDDGEWPEAGEFAGAETDDPETQSGLKSLEKVADISIVAAPGYSFQPEGGPDREAQINQINRHLIAHCERMRYRIAVLDAVNGQALMEVRAYRAQIDSKHAALYYPWVRLLDAVTEREIILPPSGFVAGIYARNDVEKGVHKAPANEVLRQAIGLELLLNKAQQDVLNPLGINCLRFFEGRGYRVWGARTITSDPEWKYVNLRRYFAYLERSIDVGTQWVVFENNGELLWANVRSTVEDFLFNEWRSGRLLGEKPEEAFFVRCDRSTMTQNDLDNGRLICLIGVAPLRPAEFVIFRIGQWTAPRQS